MDIFDRLGLNPARKPDCDTKQLAVNELDFLSDSEDDVDDEPITSVIDIHLNKISIEQLLYVANRWCSFKNGFIFKLDQISNYDWLTKETLQQCLQRLNSLNISQQARFEQKSEAENRVELFNRKVIGYFDCVDGNKIYEFKCVSKLKKEHVLQLAIYKYLYLVNRTGKKYSLNLLTMFAKVIQDESEGEFGEDEMKFYLYNILSDELMEIQGTFTDLQKMMEFLIFTKYFGKKSLDDKSFEKLCGDIRRRYIF